MTIPCPKRILQFYRSVTTSTLMLAFSLSGFGQTNFQVLKSFGFPQLSTGGNPQCTLIKGADGMLYGTAQQGGLHYLGTIFRVNPDGTHFELLHAFRGGPIDGASPKTGLLLASDGALYGTTAGGGFEGNGTVFKMNPDGSGYSILYSFSQYDVGAPQAALVEDDQGNLFGTAAGDGSYSAGAVFRMNIYSLEFRLLHSFSWSDGSQPMGSLLIGADHSLYGTTYSGGTNGAGTIFRMIPQGDDYDFITLINLDYGPNGAAPFGGLVAGSDGRLYGTTSAGGTGFSGTVFAVDTTGSNFVVLHSFTGNNGDGASPESALTVGSNSVLYGTTRYGGSNYNGCVFQMHSDGSQFQKLFNFDSQNSGPSGGLLRTENGLLGTIGSGGDSGDGAIYSIQSPDQAILLFSFNSGAGDGRLANNLLNGHDGNLYGTTASGGQYGFGTIFKIDTNGGSYVLLHEFPGAEGGSKPVPGLIIGQDGVLYGVTSAGGTNDFGTIFRISPRGAGFQILHTFGTESGDGVRPQVGVIQASDGKLYGTALPSLFTLNTDGSGYQIIHTFTSTPPVYFYDAQPLNVIEGQDGVLYGITSASYLQSPDSLLYGVQKDGSGFTALHQFTSSGTLLPLLVQGENGVLYGGVAPVSSAPAAVYSVSTNGGDFSVLRYFPGQTVSSFVPRPGGALLGSAQRADTFPILLPPFGQANSSVGVTFQMNSDGGSYKVLHDFSSQDGTPSQGLCVDDAGEIYGTSSSGGALNLGTVFKLSSTPNLPSRFLRIGNTQVVRGGSGSVSVTLGSEGNEHGLQFNIDFDAAQLSFLRATQLLAAQDAILFVDTSASAGGHITVELDLPYATVFSAGTYDVLQLNFAGAPGNGKAVVPVLFSSMKQVYDQANLLLEAEWDDGAIELFDCTATLSSVSTNVPFTLSYASFEVAISTNCDWAASSSNSWIQAYGIGTGRGEVFCTVDANPLPAGRTGIVEVAGQTFTIAQDPAPETSMLMVYISGVGTVSPDYNGQRLQVGETYEITAIPHAGFVFQGWSGDEDATTSTIQFTMRPGLTLTANFKSSPFFSAQGAFTGLFMSSDAPAADISGSISLQLTRSGAFTGNLKHAARRFGFRGQFDVNGDALVAVKTSHNETSRLALHFNDDAGIAISGSLSNDNERRSVEVHLERAAYDGVVNVTPSAGRFTMILDSGYGSNNVSIGPGYATLSVSPAGHVKVAGVLADGSRFTCGAIISGAEVWPMYAPLYHGKGCVAGWMLFPPVGGGIYGNDGLGGNLWWIKPATVKSRYAAEGLTNNLAVIGSTYTKPANGAHPVDAEQLSVVLSEGDLPNDIVSMVEFNANNGINRVEGNPLNLLFSTSSGFFRGKMVNPGTKERFGFAGVVLQSRDIAEGYFSGPTTTGKVLLTPIR